MIKEAIKQEQVTLEQTEQAIKELIVPGKTPNGKCAFWIAALSIRNGLERNCWQAAIMRSYANRPLPVNRNELREDLGRPMQRTINTLYEIEKLCGAGIIHFNCGDTYELQHYWRLSMSAIIPGMGYKTVSWALTLYNPFGCLLCAIDCWHIRRQDERYGEANKLSNYLSYELQLFKDCQELASNEGNGYSRTVYAACLWERCRQADKTGVAKANGCKDGVYQSHAGLTCYV